MVTVKGVGKANPEATKTSNKAVKTGTKNKKPDGKLMNIIAEILKGGKRLTSSEIATEMEAKHAYYQELTDDHMNRKKKNPDDKNPVLYDCGWRKSLRRELTIRVLHLKETLPQFLLEEIMKAPRKYYIAEGFEEWSLSTNTKRKENPYPRGKHDEWKLAQTLLDLNALDDPEGSKSDDSESDDSESESEDSKSKSEGSQAASKKRKADSSEPLSDEMTATSSGTQASSSTGFTPINRPVHASKRILTTTFQTLAATKEAQMTPIASPALRPLPHRANVQPRRTEASSSRSVPMPISEMRPPTPIHPSHTAYAPRYPQPSWNHQRPKATDAGKSFDMSVVPLINDPPTPPFGPHTEKQKSFWIAFVCNPENSSNNTLPASRIPDQDAGRYPLGLPAGVRKQYDTFADDDLQACEDLVALSRST